MRDRSAAHICRSASHARQPRHSGRGRFAVAHAMRSYSKATAAA